MKRGIRFKMMLGFMVVILLTTATSFFAVTRIWFLAGQTRMIGEHPLTVTREATNVGIKIVAIQRDMKDVVLSLDKNVREGYIQEMEEHERDAVESFEIIQNRILGVEGKAITKMFYEIFLNWRDIREEVISLMGEGKVKEAQAITKGKGDLYVDKLIDESERIVAYAADKALLFDREVVAAARNTGRVVIVALFLIAFFSIVIALLISKNITKRIFEINRMATKIAGGELRERIKVEEDDEITQLAGNFNIMARKLAESYESLEGKIQERTKELTDLRDKLEIKVTERTKDLEENVEKIEKGRRAMLYMVEDLNKTSRALKIANKELESFSYSVSHDLRAPLRAIDGFSGAFLEDCGETLDDTGKGYFGRIRKATIRMGELIDGILALSRLTRREMKFEEVDLSTLAEEAIKNLQEAEPDRKLAVEIQKGMTAKGDKNLLEIVVTNLLANAWKFTSKNPDAKISFSITDAGKEKAYCVMDNGAGFNMKYIDKLFGAFQRLHTEKDFEGTGIGLATVRRAISRHGGRTWAEGVEGEGAKFYFTIGK